MAQKRMIDKKISVSDQVANLHPIGQLIWTWAIPHADDVGLLPSATRSLKGLIVPLLDLTQEEFDKHIRQIVSEGLWIEFEYDHHHYYRIPNFTKYQTLKKDRQPSTLLPIVIFKDPKQTWQFLEKIGFQMEDNGFHLETEEKGREGKRREEKEDRAVVANAPTPKQSTADFFEIMEENSPEKDELLENIALGTKLSPDFVRREASKFTAYWREKTQSGRKERWETEKTFEIKRRLATWFSRAGPQKTNAPRGKQIITAS